MWTKSAECLVEISLSTAASSNYRINLPWESDEDTTVITNNFKGALKFKFNTDINVGGDDPEMCIRMTMPPINIKYLIF